MLASVPTTFPEAGQARVDAGYRDHVILWATEVLGLTLTVVQRLRRWMRAPVDPEPPPAPTRPRNLPRQSVVERGVAWLGRYRRLSKDDEQPPVTTEEAWVFAAMAKLIPCRLTQCPLFSHLFEATV